MISKTEAAVMLIKNTLKTGITTNYVLMNNMFTTESIIKIVFETGLDIIGIVIQLKQLFQL